MRRIVVRAIVFGAAAAVASAELAAQSPAGRPFRSVIVSGCLDTGQSGQYSLTKVAAVPGEEYGMKGTADNPSSPAIITSPSGAIVSAPTSTAQPQGPGVAGGTTPTAAGPGAATTGATAAQPTGVQKTIATAGASAGGMPTPPPGALAPGTAVAPGGSTTGVATPNGVAPGTPAVPGTTGTAPAPGTAAAAAATPTTTAAAAAQPATPAGATPGASAGSSVSQGAAAMAPMTPTSSVGSAVAAAQAEVSGVGPGTTSVSTPSLLLSPAYTVSSQVDLKRYRGKKVQVVGVVLSSSAGANAAAPEMQIESARVVGNCK